MERCLSFVEAINVNATGFAHQLIAFAFSKDVFVEFVKWTRLHSTAFEWAACHLRVMEMLISMLKLEVYLAWPTCECDLIEHICLKPSLSACFESFITHWAFFVQTLLDTICAEYLLARRAHGQVLHDEVAHGAGKLLGMLCGCFNRILLRIPHSSFLCDAYSLLDVVYEAGRAWRLSFSEGSVEVSQAHECRTELQWIVALWCIQLV